LKIQNTNLLPKRFSYRGALIGKLSKIKLRFPKGFTKLTIFIAVIFSLTGYYPTFNWPPVKQSITKVSAAEAQEQKGEVISLGKCYSCAAVLLVAKDEHGKKIKGAAHLFMNELTNVSFVGKLLNAIEKNKLREVVALGSFFGSESFKDEREQEKQLHILGSLFAKRGAGFIGFMRDMTPPTSSWTEYNHSNFDFYIHENGFSSLHSKGIPSPYRTSSIHVPSTSCYLTPTHKMDTRTYQHRQHRHPI